eukprot:Colp12_sorted_trinity150504_noHs@28194
MPTIQGIRETKVKIASGDVLLEAAISRPASNETPKSDVGFIITHPYGPLGGSMDNNVVLTYYKKLALAGHTCLRYNSRGIGNSTGSVSWTAVPEQEDVRSVMRFLLDNCSVTSIFIIGYSYGALVACSVAHEFPEVVGFLAISYPYSVAWALTLGHCTRFLQPAKSYPSYKYFVIGEHDQFTSPTRLLKWATASSPSSQSPTQTLNFRGADHFWVGHETALYSETLPWINDAIGVTQTKYE